MTEDELKVIDDIGGEQQTGRIFNQVQFSRIIRAYHERAAHFEWIMFDAYRRAMVERNQQQ